ncbi:MAG: hypothetical protein HC911_15905 [Chloroflexaceae bacterium]|nr:hypothetical protein [Chloroflexaceae bacterium]
MVIGNAAGKAGAGFYYVVLIAEAGGSWAGAGGSQRMDGSWAGYRASC